MRLLKLLIHRSKGTFALAVLVGLLSGASSSALIMLINRSLVHGTFRSSTTLAAFAGVLCVGMLLRICAQVLLNRLNFGALYELRMHLFRRVLASPLRQLEELGNHRVTAMLAEDIPAVTTSLMALPTLTINAAALLGCLVYLATLSRLIFVFLLGFIVVGLGVYQLPTRLGLGILQQARTRSDAFFKLFRAVLEGNKELKLHAQRRSVFLHRDVEATARDMQRLGAASANLFNFTASWGGFLFFTFIGLLLFVLTRFTDLDSATLTSCTLTVLFLQQPLDSMMSSVHFLSRGSVALEKLQRLEPQVWEFDLSSPQALPPPVQRFEHLELRGITHAYFRDQDERPFTLGPINLSLRPGELVFIIGGNGSGKTTLAKLLTGLYVPESGEILLDGQPVTDARREHYRQHFSTVFSDFFLFDNLLGLTSPEREPQVKAYLERLHLERKVQISGDGTLSTTALSQGQRKRLALLTAYLEDRPIYLFDEWAADQDPLFKDIFYQQLLPELRSRGKAVVVISHDNRYFHVADRILQLDSGRMMEDAPPTGPLLPGQRAAS
ncbi:cyclic peptide export ABC transporter [Corallococcus llansteffanensis]|uniref:Cyclic peptide export ABC transporter n=1 Tax=Corallococcus llansteffanensis TaxID=2316731 RepID=A0A3A8PKV2_9BACT|nr:cyclic peptide export ABC transporter [Corallococcus llansteffanensis]RKH57016.1 cyclic peptide export ABC transporter [Corallococcus llansteffanensis]